MAVPTFVDQVTLHLRGGRGGNGGGTRHGTQACFL